jgi:hypothetical protein
MSAADAYWRLVEDRARCHAQWALEHTDAELAQRAVGYGHEIGEAEVRALREAAEARSARARAAAPPAATIRLRLL